MTLILHKYFKQVINILPDTPCGNDCPSAQHTGFFSHYLHCDGICRWSEEDGLGFQGFTEDGHPVRTKYERLCDGLCQDAAIPCRGKCLEVEKLSNLDCSGVCSDPAKPSGIVTTSRKHEGCLK